VGLVIYIFLFLVTAGAVITNYDITLPINPQTLTTLIAKVLNATATDYTVKWRFGFDETKALNQSNIILDSAGPFIGDINNLTVELNPGFFKEDFSYIVILDITRANQGSSVTVPIPFTLIMNSFPKDGILVTIPKIGFYNTTNYLLSCQKFKDENTAAGELKYKFVYVPYNDASKEILIQDYSLDNETNIIMDLPPEQTKWWYKARCYCQDSMGAITKVEGLIGVYDNPVNSGIDLPLSQILEGNDFDSKTLTPDEIYKRTLALQSLAKDKPKKFIFNSTEVKISSTSINLTLLDPVCDDNYCNRNGTCYLIDKQLTCLCDPKYTGSNCQIDVASYDQLHGYYTSIYNSLMDTLQTDSSGYVPQGLRNLVNGASLFHDDASFLYNGLDFVDLAQAKYPYSFINQADDYFDYYNDMISWGVNMVNKYKILDGISNNITAPEIRNSTLTLAQQSSVSGFFDKVKSSLERLTKFLSTFSRNATQVIVYNSKNLNVYVTFVSSQFSFKDFFTQAQANYSAWFDAQDCLNYIMPLRYNTRSYNLMLSYIDWITTPFIYNNVLYFNNSSPMTGINFYDFDTGKDVKIDGCENNTITLYFPVINQNLPNFINTNRLLMDPSKQFDMKSSIFSDPVFIEKTGEVNDKNLTERRSDFFVSLNFTCDWYNDENAAYENSGCSYSNYTDDNYFLCKCAHMTDFLVNLYSVDRNFGLNSRFFYLSRYELLTYPGNYFSNMAFYILAAVLGLYIGVIVFYSFCDFYIYRRLGVLDYLKKTVVRLNIPYKRRYNFNIDLNFNKEALHRISRGTKSNQDKKIKKTRGEDDDINADLYLAENKDLQIKDIDVLILGDNLAARNKLDNNFFESNPKEELTQVPTNRKNASFYQNDNLEAKPRVKPVNNEEAEKKKAEQKRKEAANTAVDFGDGDVLNFADLEATSDNKPNSTKRNLGETDDLDKQYNNFVVNEIDREPEIIVNKRGMGMDTEDSYEDECKKN
jgi:hypothetical protein